MNRATTTPAKVVKRKTGRPSKFGTVDMELVRKLAEYGHDDVFMAQCCRVSERTWNTWKTRHPEFSQSLKGWKSMADEQVVKALYERAIGCSCVEERFVTKNGEPEKLTATKYYPPDPTSMIFWLKNRRRADWRDKQELEHFGGLNVKVSIITDKPPELPARPVDAERVNPPMLEGEVIEQLDDVPDAAPDVANVA